MFPHFPLFSKSALSSHDCLSNIFPLFPYFLCFNKGKLGKKARVVPATKGAFKDKGYEETFDGY